VAGGDDRCAPAGSKPKRLSEQLRVCLVELGCRLVDDHEIGLDRECTGYGDALTLSTGEQANLSVAQAAEVEFAQPVLDQSLVVRLAAARARDLQCLRHFERLGQVHRLSGIGDTRPPEVGQRVPVEVAEIRALDLDATRVGAVQTCE
jgi:hypothetical protein